MSLGRVLDKNVAQTRAYCGFRNGGMFRRSQGPFRLHHATEVRGSESFVCYVTNAFRLRAENVTDSQLRYRQRENGIKQTVVRLHRCRFVVELALVGFDLWSKHNPQSKTRSDKRTICFELVLNPFQISRHERRNAVSSTVSDSRIEKTLRRPSDPCRGGVGRRGGRAGVNILAVPKIASQIIIQEVRE